MSVPILIALFGAGVLGIAIGYYLRYLHALSKREGVELNIKEKLIAAEEKALKIVEKAEAKVEQLEKEKKQELKEIEEKLSKTEDRLIKKEELLDNRQIDIDSEVENVRQKIDQVKEIKTQLDERAKSIETKLEEVAGLTKEEAREQTIRRMEAESSDDLAARIQKLEAEGDSRFDEKAKGLLATAIFRLGNVMPGDIMTSIVELPSDDMKGKIIGKEGRNVRAFERATGVDVLIDESPGHIVLSSFDPLRREIARVALEKLVADGRIQPAKIEEIVDKAKQEVGQTMQKMGEKAATDAGVPGLHADLLRILGRLHFRTSYGQNVLWHSVEMAHLAGMLAEEIGADVGIARAGALLHDIGKAVSHEVQGTHVEIGRRILQKYDVDERVTLAMQAHHEEYPYETIESMLVQVADALSGGRPGARRDSLENYIKRIGDLEQVALDMPGVEKAFAIQAGREVRVFVSPEKITDFEAHNLARDIAKQIETKLRYPGEIKVNVIRETRVIEFAR
ncbi:ribonuclease Y [Candidatus Parcubacteria bacterium]|uniref:Ribonuclease Y n=1 Tax=Candidatus Kaiserbacteria bacterium CG10_big_fil_rev_8_21_14_0_10_47_16 TaxID=1974608 RepID=A0A2H0UDS0_9BACT|nr:ribonuclease Y [Candidatus Parcubacteria bacterium]PIR84573.1 MAG: ribonuclease Y [Candidatus Kaiserbacteria bacterium CG10_big_fil_rev_8_21_14_0_10_47_16]